MKNTRRYTGWMETINPAYGSFPQLGLLGHDVIVSGSQLTAPKQPPTAVRSETHRNHRPAIQPVGGFCGLRVGSASKPAHICIEFPIRATNDKCDDGPNGRWTKWKKKNFTNVGDEAVGTSQTSLPNVRVCKSQEGGTYMRK